MTRPPQGHGRTGGNAAPLRNEASPAFRRGLWTVAAKPLVSPPTSQGDGMSKVTQVRNQPERAAQGGRAVPDRRRAATWTTWRPEGAAHAVFLRSPVAHARDRRARRRRGARRRRACSRSITAADLAGKLGERDRLRDGANRDGSAGAAPRRPMLADDRVRYAGEAIAHGGGRDAAPRRSTRSRLIAFDFDDLPVHVATAVGGPAIHPEAPDNLAYDWAFGDEAEVARPSRRRRTPPGSSSSTTG